MTRRSLIAPTAVIFDFDLTLVDSRPGFLASHRHASGQLGLSEPTVEAIGRSIGTPIEKIVPGWYPDLTAERTAEYIRIYRAKADEVMADLTQVLPGASETLATLHDAGVQLALVSQKLRYLIEAVLEREGMRFEVVLGGQDVPDFKPDPSGLRLAMEKLWVEPDDAIYVGDTTIDAEAAANAGLRFVGVLSGVTSKDDFAPYASIGLLDGVGDLPGFLGL
jgi:phosphoglycolate phosphatase